MTKREAFTDFDERTILESLRPELTKPETLRFSLEEIEATEASIPTILNEKSISDIQTEPTEPDLPQTSVASGVPQEDRTTASERMGMKQRKAALEIYRRRFLQVPKIENRKPVFVSCEVRDKLDEIVRRLGGRRMSVSGLIENLARHHLEVYSEEIERWRKL